MQTGSRRRPVLIGAAIAAVVLAGALAVAIAVILAGDGDSEAAALQPHRGRFVVECRYSH